MGAWPVYYMWPMPSHFIFEQSDNWLNTHMADRGSSPELHPPPPTPPPPPHSYPGVRRPRPIIILLIGRNHVTVSHMARKRWLEVFWILLIGSRYRSAYWDLWNGTIDRHVIPHSAEDVYLWCHSINVWLYSRCLSNTATYGMSDWDSGESESV